MNIYKPDLFLVMCNGVRCVCRVLDFTDVWGHKGASYSFFQIALQLYNTVRIRSFVHQLTHLIHRSQLYQRQHGDCQ
jgi:hypothetical protein